MADVKTRKMGNDTLGRERRQDLKNRINAVRPWNIDDEKNDPPEIATARKLVDSYDRRQRKAKDEKRSAAQHAIRIAQSRLLATDSYDDGLKIVEAFERDAKKRGWLREKAED